MPSQTHRRVRARGAAVALLFWLGALASCSDDHKLAPANASGASGDSVGGDAPSATGGDETGGSSGVGAAGEGAGPNAGGATQGAAGDGTGGAETLGQISLKHAVAPTTGHLLGVVRDADTQRGIVGATVDFGATNVQTTATGAFELGAPAGPASVMVEAAGYLPWRGTLVSAEPALFDWVTLKRRATAISVPAGGRALASAGTSLNFAPGSYTSDTPVAFTVVSQLQLGSISGPAMFADDGRDRTLLTVVDISGPDPALPAVLSLPVPAGLTSGDVSLYELDDATGAWGKPIAPTSVISGVASFSVPTFSVHALAVPTLASSYFVIDVHGKVLAQRPGEPQRVLRTGDFVRTDATIATERGTYVSLVSSNAGIIRVQPTTRLKLGPAQNDFTLLGAGAVYLNVPSAQTPSSDLCYRVVTPDVAVEVRCARDAIFFVKRVECPSATAWTDLVLEQGAVEATVGEETQTLDSRQRGYACVGCALLPAAAAPACCNAETCPNGCCTELGTCVAGTARNECGGAGALCRRCGAFECQDGACESACRTHQDCAGAGNRCVNGKCSPCGGAPTSCPANGCFGDQGNQCLSTGCGTQCGRCTATEVCGDGIDNDCDGVVDGTTANPSLCLGCSKNDDCPDSNLAIGGNYCAGGCRACPPGGCRYCQSHADCGWLESCTGGLCVACGQPCAASAIVCGQGQCPKCPDCTCTCSPEFGNGCTEPMGSGCPF